MKQKLNNHEENKQETHIQNSINLEKNKLSSLKDDLQKLYIKLE